MKIYFLVSCGIQWKLVFQRKLLALNILHWRRRYKIDGLRCYPSLEPGPKKETDKEKKRLLMSPCDKPDNQTGKQTHKELFLVHKWENTLQILPHRGRELNFAFFPFFFFWQWKSPGYFQLLSTYSPLPPLPIKAGCSPLKTKMFFVF